MCEGKFASVLVENNMVVKPGQISKHLVHFWFLGQCGKTCDLYYEKPKDYIMTKKKNKKNGKRKRIITTSNKRQALFLPNRHIFI